MPTKTTHHRVTENTEEAQRCFPGLLGATHSTPPLEWAGRADRRWRGATVQNLSFKVTMKAMVGELSHSETTNAANNLRELLELRVSATPDKAFLFSEADGRRFTYGEFDAAVNRAASLLFSHDVRKGDAVSLLLP